MIFGHEARLRNFAAPLQMGFSCICVLGISFLAVGFLSGCKNFWAAPAGSTEIALTNSGNITVAAGTPGTSTITVTPENSWTGTVTLSCAVTESIASDTSPATCSLSPTSLSISSTTAGTATLTATTTATTTAGAYTVTVTGTTTDGTTATTPVCVAVGSGTCTSNAGTSGVFYVLNQTPAEITPFTVSSAGLTTVAPATALPATGASAVAVGPLCNCLYVSTQSGIFLYNIASDGTLTLANTQAISQDPATSMQVDATNSWLVDVVSGIGSVNAISIDPTTGALASNSEQSFPLPSEYPFQVAVSPTDSSSCTDCYAFVAMQTGGTEVIHFNPASAQPFTSSIGTLKLVNANSSDNAVAVDPQNRLLYVGETIAVSGTQTGGLRAFTISSSGVSEIAGSPFASGGTAPSSILPTADGSYVYVANGSVSGNADGNITGFSVTATSLTAIGTTAAGPSGRLGLAEDSTGSYLLAIDSAGGPDLQAYTMSSGALTSAVTDPTGTDPVKAIGIAALP